MAASHDFTGFHEALANCASELSNVGRKLDSAFERLAGPYHQVMLKGREITKSYLTDADPLARCTAICLMMNRWEPDAEFIRHCEEVALRDVDKRVRGLTASSLAWYYRGSNNARIGELIAQIVSDQDEDVDVRLAAYRSLFHLRAEPVESRPALAGFRFPEDVDWNYVNRFLKDKQP